MTSTAFRDRNRTANTKNYREWLEDHRILVEMTEAEGFTRDQAVEMVKAYYLYSIESNMGWNVSIEIVTLCKPLKNL